MTCGELPKRPMRMSGTLPVSIRRANVANHAAALGVTGLLTKPWSRFWKMFGPIERSSGASSAVLILDPCWSLRSFIGWQACCGDFVVPPRSKRAYLSSRVNFCPRAGKSHPTHPVKREGPRPGPMAIAKGPARTDEMIRRRGIAKGCRRLCTRCAHDCRTPAPSPNVSCAFSILTRPCLIAWAPMKRDYGARPRKRFGPSRRCDSRRRQTGGDCATGPHPSAGIRRGRSPKSCVRSGSLR
jgi:hypothetical protein